VLAIGKDVYCDTACIIDTIQTHFPTKALPTSPADEAYSAFSNRTFQLGLYLFDLTQIPEAFIRDREGLFPTFRRPDFADHRPSALASAKAALDVVGNEFLGNSAWIGGDNISLADVHVSWVVRWLLEGVGLGKVEGFGEEDFPKIYKWLAKLPGKEAEVLSAEDATNSLLKAEYFSSNLSVDPKDALGLSEGTLVSVETVDDATGENKQFGKLIGVTRKEVIVSLDNGIRVHFPRIGCCVKPATGPTSGSSL